MIGSSDLHCIQLLVRIFTPFIQVRRFFGLLCSAFIMSAIIISLVTINIETAYAQSKQCISLKRQLASIGSGGGKPSAKYLQYKRAVGQQTSQIRKTKRAMRKNGCFLARSSSKCRRIKSSLAKMQANLSSLQKKTRSLSPRSSNQRQQRAKILRAMKRNKCGAAQPSNAKRAVKKEQPHRRTLLEQLFGVKTYSNDGTIGRSDGGTLPKSNFGTYRSLCVRTCDGYYFPISFSTTKNRLRADQKTCENMCPGTETTLFYHKMPSQDAEQSISLRTGQPYTSLDNAFAYRKSVNPQCTCRASTKSNFEEIAGGTDKPVDAEVEERQYIALPVLRKDPNLDPETLLNRAGNLTPKKLANIAADDDQIASKNTDDIRIVGPAFYPVQ